MKKYLLTVGLCLALVLLLVVVAFFYVQSALAPNTTEGPQGAGDDLVASTSAGVPTRNGEESALETITPAPNAAPESQLQEVVVEESIPITDIPLSDNQRAFLKTIGVGEDFVVTPDMISCTKSALGEDRFNQIAAGSLPTAWETVTLLRCL